jgi:hypothetical protein
VTRGHSTTSAYIRERRRDEKMELVFTRSHPEKRIPAGEEWREDYVMKRDADREKRGLPPVWGGLTYRFAAKLWKKKGKGIAINARNARLCFNKIWDGRNEGKGTGDGSPLECPLCEELDGMQHWTCECLDPALSRVRDRALRNINEAARQATQKRGQWTPSQALVDLVETTKGMLLVGPERHRTWCGLWSETQRRDLNEHLRHLEEAETDKFRSFVVRLGNLTTDAVIQIWECRKTETRRGNGDGLRNEDEENREQAPFRRRTIIDFFGGPVRGRGRRVNPRRRKQRNTGQRQAQFRKAGEVLEEDQEESGEETQDGVEDEGSGKGRSRTGSSEALAAGNTPLE